MKEIGLHAQNTLTIRGMDVYDHLMSTSIYTLIMHKIFIGVPKFTRFKWLHALFGLVNHLALIMIVCFTSCEKWCREKSFWITHI